MLEVKFSVRPKPLQCITPAVGAQVVEGLYRNRLGPIIDGVYKTLQAKEAA